MTVASPRGACGAAAPHGGQVVRSVVLFEPGPAPSCGGTCHRIPELLRRAVRPSAMDLTRIDRLPATPVVPEPDVVVVRAPAGPRLADVIAPLRRTWRSALVLGTLCSGSVGADELFASVGEVDDFVFCPFSELDLVTRVRRLLPRETTPRAERVGDQLEMLVGESAVFLEAIARAMRFASSSATVLIGGETGVGKGLFARAVHYNGARRSKPFVPVNCSALPDHLFENELFGHVKGAYTDAATSQRGLIEEADGGTLFLDEIDSLPASSQAKLLRLLQDGEYRPLGSARTHTADARVIAGTNANLRQLVTARQFRTDLFHRLNVLTMTVPPLRERRSDIPLLARHFVARFGAQYGRPALRLDPATSPKLLAFPWPGNVRELESLLHRAVVVAPSDVIEPADIDLPDAANGSERRTSRAPKDDAMGEFERRYLTHLLADHHGNVSRAAIAAGRDRRSFQRLLRRHGIDRTDYRDAR